jgi:hypothetical protein
VEVPQQQDGGPPAAHPPLLGLDLPVDVPGVAVVLAVAGEHLVGRGLLDLQAVELAVDLELDAVLDVARVRVPLRPPAHRGDAVLGEDAAALGLLVLHLGEPGQVRRSPGTTLVAEQSDSGVTASLLGRGDVTGALPAVLERPLVALEDLWNQRLHVPGRVPIAVDRGQQRGRTV